MGKKKRSTPEHLDYLFERELISRSLYVDFWVGYWDNKSRRHSERKYVDSFVSRNQLELPFNKRAKVGSITFSHAAAKEQATNIGGYVRRVTKTGRPSKHGRFYQAVRRGKKKL